jgi:hypothetical protein
VPGLINGISDTNCLQEGVLAFGFGTQAAAALCLKLEHGMLKDMSVMLDLLRKYLTCAAAQLENELNTLNPSLNHSKFLPSVFHFPWRIKGKVLIRVTYT